MLCCRLYSSHMIPLCMYQLTWRLSHSQKHTHVYVSWYFCWGSMKEILFQLLCSNISWYFCWRSTWEILFQLKCLYTSWYFCWGSTWEILFYLLCSASVSETLTYLVGMAGSVLARRHCSSVPLLSGTQASGTLKHIAVWSFWVASYYFWQGKANSQPGLCSERFLRPTKTCWIIFSG